MSIVRAYFETTLNTWAASQSPVIPISFENKPFIKPSAGNFIECFLLPAATVARTAKGDKLREVGIFQINIWAPNGEGSNSAQALADSIAVLFPLVPKNGAVSIEKPPSIERAIYDTSGWYVVPLIIHYRHETY
jgi:hypothetical protein